MKRAKDQIDRFRTLIDRRFNGFYLAATEKWLQDRLAAKEESDRAARRAVYESVHGPLSESKTPNTNGRDNPTDRNPPETPAVPSNQVSKAIVGESQL